MQKAGQLHSETGQAVHPDRHQNYSHYKRFCSHH